ncbi:flagellar biosynthesis anti-sigma factor FlgM [Bacillus suaedae]|uniref:Negative regulator of flagellin synthesis n=1 Tax=Halalkalibacter suaedae TaxID=2822140 RepID=A0A940WSX0_9BACI|nr:flagellar biosynthesis anti-sigma factor FlgM [Bacillus suaedae]MBP3950042.1 flagellar biosynthesis anti-sigma factor FlgM [Bacillus suaedae]
MKINPYLSVQQNPYKKQVDKTEKAYDIKAKSDKLEISTEALKMQQVTQVDPARQAKVDALKQKIEAGEYKVDAQAVAAKFYDYWNE